MQQLDLSLRANRLEYVRLGELRANALEYVHLGELMLVSSSCRECRRDLQRVTRLNLTIASHCYARSVGLCQSVKLVYAQVIAWPTPRNALVNVEMAERLPFALTVLPQESVFKRPGA